TYPSLFASLSANKRSIVLDLKDDDDRRRALELAAEADVVIEGYRPGVADRLGVGVHDVRAVNPSVIYCSVSGLGQDGPLAQAPPAPRPRVSTGRLEPFPATAPSRRPTGGMSRSPCSPRTTSGARCATSSDWRTCATSSSSSAWAVPRSSKGAWRKPFAAAA